jgi:hypothetical protein
MEFIGRGTGKNLEMHNPEEPVFHLVPNCEPLRYKAIALTTTVLLVYVKF